MSKTKKFKLEKSHVIGSPDAETDEFLMNVFIQISNLNEILDTKNQKSILIGRTGSGKSAMIKYITEKCENVEVIAPEAMSLRFLSNSTILKYFKSIGVNLNLFYKVLWKHVLIVELLKMYFEEENSGSKRSTKLQSLIDKIKRIERKEKSRKERAVKYMESWANDFWEQTEIRIKSFERSIQEKFADSMGIQWDFLSLNLSNEQFTSDKFIIEAKHKAESIIHSSQAIELLDIVDIMKEDLFNNHQKKFYVVIDDLDREWIEDSVRYELIGSLIEVIKEFRQLSGVKIVISLRENLNELVNSSYSNKGGQREKLKPLYSEIRWEKTDLTNLIDQRLKLLSSNELDVKNAFFQSRRNNESGMDYVLQRTFSRPRDVISFVNHIIEKSTSKGLFTKDIISKAEPEYSVDRFNALEDEWSENFGKLSLLCEFLKGINDGFRLKSISEDKFIDVYIEDAGSEFRGDLLNIVQEWRAGKINYIGFLKKVMFILYRIGIIGVKKGPTYKTAYYYDKDVLIERNDISNNSRFYVHPSMYSYFKINVLAQLPEGE